MAAQDPERPDPEAYALDTPGRALASWLDGWLRRDFAAVARWTAPGWFAATKVLSTRVLEATYAQRWLLGATIVRVMETDAQSARAYCQLRLRVGRAEPALVEVLVLLDRRADGWTVRPL